MSTQAVIRASLGLVVLVVAAVHSKKPVQEATYTVEGDCTKCEDRELCSKLGDGKVKCSSMQAVLEANDELAKVQQSESPQDWKLSNLVVIKGDSFDYKSHEGIVLFHIMKYDHRSRFVLQMFDEATGTLPAHQFSTMDCHVWTDVCKKIAIAQFPTIRLYKQGTPYTYQGPRSVAGFTRLGMLSLFDAPHKIGSMSDVVQTRQACIDSNLDTMFIGLFRDDNSQEYNAYKQAAANLVGQKLMTVAVGDFAERIRGQFSLPPLPVVLSYSPTQRDPTKAISVYKDVMHRANIEHFAFAVGLPPFVELTPQLLPLLRVQQKPQLILFVDELPNDVFKEIEKLSTDEGLEQQFGFTFVLKNIKEETRRKIQESLTGSLVAPFLVVTDYDKGKVFQYSAETDDAWISASIRAWLHQIISGDAGATKDLQEDEWQPIYPGYDYLSLKEQADKSRKAQLEHGQLDYLDQTTLDSAITDDAAEHTEL